MKRGKVTAEKKAEVLARITARSFECLGLRPGMSAAVELSRSGDPEVLSVPAEAVIEIDMRADDMATAERLTAAMLARTSYNPDVRIEVEDTGVGIAAADLLRLFVEQRDLLEPLDEAIKPHTDHDDPAERSWCLRVQVLLRFRSGCR